MDDLNQLKSNFPAIDLGDKSNKICIQITASHGRQKIQNTIDKFIYHKLYKDYNRLIIFVITDKEVYKNDFETNKKFTFNKDNDIWDLDDVISDIDSLDTNKIESINSFLSVELYKSISDVIDTKSILAGAEKDIDQPPDNAEAFFMASSYDPNDIPEAYEAVIKFYKKLSELTREAREFLYIGLINSEKRKAYSDKLVLPVEKLRGKSCLTDEKFFKLHGLLENVGFSDVERDTDDGQDYYLLHYKMEDSWVNIFPLLKDFANNQDDLKSIIVDGNFKILDK